jgi:hypothetical protein
MLLLSVACSDDDDDRELPPQGSESELCNDLAALGTAVDKVRELNMSSSNTDIENALNGVKTAGQDVRSSFQSGRAEARQNIEASLTQLETALNQASAEGSLVSVQSALNSAAAEASGKVALARTGCG